MKNSIEGSFGVIGKRDEVKGKELLSTVAQNKEITPEKALEMVWNIVPNDDIHFTFLTLNGFDTVFADIYIDFTDKIIFDIDLHYDFLMYISKFNRFCHSEILYLDIFLEASNELIKLNLTLIILTS